MPTEKTQKPEQYEYLGWFIVSVILFLFCVATFIVLMLVKPRTHTFVPQPDPNFRGPRPAGLELSYLNSDGNINIFDPAKPLRLEMTKDGIVKNAFLFAYLRRTFETIATETQEASHAFFFSVARPVTVVSLQIFDSIFALGSRDVGIFDTTNIGTGQPLVLANVSKSLDPLFQGFRTHPLPLNQQVQLLPGILYACIALLEPGDFYPTAANFAQPLNIMNMDVGAVIISGEGFTGRRVGNTLSVPANNAQNDNPNDYRIMQSLASPAASMQLQEKRVPHTSVFEVDTQFARFPPSYINGFKCEVLSNNLIKVTPGVAASANGDANLWSGVDLSITVPTGTSQTWYGIFVVDKSTVPGSYDASLVVSTNFNELREVPSLRARRVGWARTPLGSGVFIRSETEGTEVRRDTTFLELFDQRFFGFTQNDPTVQDLVLSNIPPTANECRVQLNAQFLSETDLPQTKLDVTIGDNLIHLNLDQSFQILQTTLVIDTTQIPRQLPVSMQFDSVDPLNVCLLTVGVIGFTEDI